MIAFNDLARELAPIRDQLGSALTRVLDSGWYALGNEVRAFETEFAAWLGGGEVVGVANGTDALELALRALGVGFGDAVLTAANAGGYATTAILACGATPRYCDIDADSGLIGPAQLDAASLDGVRALVVTHLYGRMAPMPALLAHAEHAGVAVIEDCAQAHGARLDGRAAGHWGQLGCFSFYPTKNLGALGDGGAVASRDAELAQRLRQLRQYGWQDKYLQTLPGGRNSRLDEIQAACLRVRLPGLEAANARRRNVFRRYLAGLDHPAIRLPAGRAGSDDACHLFVLQCPQRDALAAHLAGRGVQTAVHYPVPDHLQPARAPDLPAVRLPETERRATELLSLPCHSALTDQDIEHVIDACNSFRA